MSDKVDRRASLSSSNPPPNVRSRRGSAVSLSTKSVQDKEVSTQVLDDLHTSASRSTELTAFPPPPPSANEERGRTAQQGLGGLYSRIKASITTSADDNASADRPGSNSSNDGSTKPSWPTQPKRSRPVETVDDQSQVLSPDLNFSSDTAAKVISGNTVNDVNVVPRIQRSEENDLQIYGVSQVNPTFSSQITMSDQLEVHTRSRSRESRSREKNASEKSAGPRLDPEAISADESPNNRRHHRTSTNKSETESQALPKPHLTVVTNSTETSPINRVKSRDSISQAHRRDKSQSSTTGKPNLSASNGALESNQLASNISTAAPSTITSANPESKLLPASSRRTVSKVAAKQSSKAPNQSFVHQMRHKILSRDFWMKDENAKVCFGCGDSFSTFRRKHHCRLCGQIFCSSCTKLVSGKPFGQASKLRVCKTCEVMMNGDDSSDDYTEDEDAPMTAHTNKQIRFGDMPRINNDIIERASLDRNTDFDKPMTPSSSSSAYRRSRDGKRKSIQLDRTPILPRPSSSRSLKSNPSTRPRSSSQKTRRLRTQHMRSLGVVADDDVPFQRASDLGEPGELSLPVLHADSVIDPDLAPFLSDDNSSEEETPNIAAALNNDFNEHTSGFPSSIFGALKRARSYGPGKQFIEPNRGGRDADIISVDSARPARIRRQMGSRSASVASFNLQNSSPRASKADTFLASSDNLHAMAIRGSFPIDQSLLPLTDTTFEDRTKVPDAGLNPAGLAYIRALLRQFLTDAQVEHVRKWEKALLPVLLKCAEYVDPNIHHGDAIDIRHYVKLKRAPGGSPADTYYVSGVVFSKNVALRSMPRRLIAPRILLISFPIVYARQQQHFMSLEPVIAQEREYLRNLVGRIKALRPTILLVQRDVSGLALEFLHEAKIVVAYNIKSSVLQAMARCTQTRIVTSPERLNTSFNALGTCGGFEVRTYVSHKIKKTVMSFSGCPKDLGCTIVLRGASSECLARVKWITEFMCYVTYSLKLETCLMQDEFTELPETLTLDDTPKERPSTGSLRLPLTRPSTSVGAQEHRQEAGDDANAKSNHARGHSIDQDNLFKDIPAGPFDALVRKLASRQLSASPFVKLGEPWLLLRGRDCEQRMGRIRKWQQTHQKANGEEIDEKHPFPQKFEIIKLDMARHAGPKSSPLAHDVLHAMREAEHDRASYHYGNIKRSWERYTSGAPDFLSPLNHQRIMVAFSIVSTPTLDACDGPDLLGLDYYQEHDIDENLEQDVPLGEYVERLCNQAELPCIARRCDKRMIDHHRQYVHGDGQVSIYLQRYPSRYKGLENTILMWSECRKCKYETPPTPMSANTWKYSFGKYLELSFWGIPLKPRNGLCDHDIHHDHNRYFGFKSLAIRVQYDKINIVEITVPRTTITWMVEKDLLLKNSQYGKAEERISRFMASVRHRISSINTGSIAPEKVEASKIEIERLTKKANDETEWLLDKLHEKYNASQYFELIPMNQAVRFVEQKVNEWDIAFADFERDYFPSERDIRRLAALQIKKAFLDREHSETGDTDEKALADHRIAETELQKLRTKPETTVETGDIPLTTFCATAVDHEQNNDGIPAIGDMPTESLFRESTSATLQEHEQLVQTLDLAVPPSAVLTVPKIGEESSDTADSILGTIVRRDSIAPPPKPQPLEQDLVEKIEQMQVVTNEQQAAEPTTPEKQREDETDVQVSNSDVAVLSMPPMLRSKTQPEFVAWPDPDTPVKPSTSPEVAQMPQFPLVPFTSRIPVAPTALLADRIANNAAMRTGKSAMHSMIPRAVKKQESKVSALAKHFEEMSREFEKERLRERRQRAAKNRESRAYPMIVSRPIVEVFRDAHEAVQERDIPEEDDKDSTHQMGQQEEDYLDDDPFLDALPRNKDRADELDAQSKSLQVDSEPAKETDDDLNTVASYPASDVDVALSDTEEPSVTDIRGSLDLSDKSIFSIFEQQQDEGIELPKHEKTSLLKMLTSFWSERSASGWSPLDYPLASTDHIFENSDIIVREDEPSSLIAFTLASEDYYNKLQTFRRRAMTVDMIQAQATPPTGLEMPKSQADIDVERVMLGKTATHINYKFQHGSARIHVKVFYAESFDAIRRKCGVEDRFVESLSRSVKWDSKGGKTKSLFLKTLDERFVLKSLSTIETQAFVKFAPDYFDYMSKCLFHGLPSAIAKMLGFYQVVIRNPATGTDLNYYLQVMENVFYEGPQATRVFDLKGSMRNRRIQSTGEADEVLLDENLLDYISANPVYVRAHSNSLLDSSIKNDTLFCSKQNVMDYSLIAALHDAPRNELSVGIIDYIRTYTWDKKIESWIKDRGKHKPTVMSPKDYRTRFRKSIPRYFPLVPSPWQVFGSGVGNRLEGDGDGIGTLGARGEEIIDEEEEGEEGAENE